MSRTLITGVVLAAFGLGILVGRFHFPSRSAAPVSNDIPEHSAPSGKPAAEAMDPERVPDRAELNGNAITVERSLDEIRHELLNCAAIPNVSDATRCAVDTAARVRLQDIEAALDFSTAMLPRGAVREEVQLKLLERWAALDPVKALAWTAQLPVGIIRERATQQIIAVWSARNPAEAAQHVLGFSPTRFRLDALRNLINVWLRSDAPGAVQWVERLTGSSLQNQLRQTIRNGIARADLPTALRVYAEQSDSRARLEMTASIAEAWAERDLPGAIEWVKRLPAGAERDRALQATIRLWAQSDPAGAAAYSLAYKGTDSTVKQRVLQNVATQWAAVDPAGAMAWVSGLEGEEQSRMAGAVALQLAENDPAGAARWMASLPASDANWPAAVGVISRWIRVDPEAAAEWGLRFPENRREAALHQVGRDWTFLDLDATTQWLQTLPAGAARDAAIQGFVQSADGMDIARAAQWANSIGHEPKREELVRNMVERWLIEDEPAARLWLNRNQSTLPPGVRERFNR